MIKYQHYKVDERSPIPCFWAAFKYHRDKQIEARAAFAIEVGADGVYASASAIAGFLFKVAPGDPWRPVRGQCATYSPAGRTPAATKTRRRMQRDYPLDGLEWFQDKVIGEQGTDLKFFIDFSFCYMHYDEDFKVLLVPKTPDERWTPPPVLMCTKIKESEYLALKGL